MCVWEVRRCAVEKRWGGGGRERDAHAVNLTFSISSFSYDHFFLYLETDVRAVLSF